MGDPAEDSPPRLTHSDSDGGSDLDQTTTDPKDMDDNSCSDPPSTADPMATTSSFRPSAVHSHSRDTESSSMTRCGQSNSDYLCSGTGGPSNGAERTSIVDFDGELEGMMPQRTDSLEIRKNPQHNPTRPISIGSLYGPYPIHWKTHTFEQFGLNRQSSGSSTFTSEPPGLTADSRATTFDQTGPPVFEDNVNHLSESPVGTPGLTQRMLDPRDLDDQSSHDLMKPPARILTGGSSVYCRSPLRRSMDLRETGQANYSDYRSPKPEVMDSDSDVDDDEVSNIHFECPFLPSDHEGDDDCESELSDSECSEQLDEIDETHPLFEIKTPVVKQILREYREWTASASGGKSTAGQGTGASRAKDNTSQRKKRTRDDESEETDKGEGGDQGGDEPPKKKPVLSPSSNNGAPKPSLACPFAKKDQVRYERCFSHKITDIKYVKQHLRRIHTAPVYCPICRDIFDDEDVLAGHLRQEQRCEQSDKPAPEGMTPVQQRRLKDRAKASMSKEEQWYEIFEILFPGAPRPQSPWVPAGLDEKIRGFADLVNERGHAIIMENITQREELMQRLEGMGLRANQAEEQMIFSLLSTSISEGLQTVTHDYMATVNMNLPGNVPSLTEGETLESSNQADDEDTPDNDEDTPNLVARQPTIAPQDEPMFESDPTQDAMFSDSLILFPQDASMQTPNLTGGEWEQIDPNCIDPSLTQNTFQQKWTDAAMFESFMRASGSQQGRQS